MGRARIPSCSITKDAAGPSTRALAQRLASSAWTIYRTLPDEPQTKFDLVRFSLKVPGLARELWMVLFMALLAALFGLSIPIAAGILVDQVIPEADLDESGCDVWFPGRPLALGGDIPGDARALGSSHRRPCVGDDHSGGLGPIASASHEFFRQDSARVTWPSGRWNSPRFSRRSPGRR